MKDRDRRAEMLTGYAMVLPAILVVCVISIYPILQTFYFSLFDYQLNNPTKRNITTQSYFDLEKYLDAQFYLNSGLKKQLNKVEDAQTLEALEHALEKYQQIDAEICALDEVVPRYDAVSAAVNAMKPITDDDLKYIPMSEEDVSYYKQLLTELRTEIMALRATDGDDYSQIAGMIDDVTDSLISSNYIGFRNYSALAREIRITESGEMDRLLRVLVNTLGFTIITVFFEMVFGLAVAHLANRKAIGRGVTRAVMLIPWAIPTAVSSMMWRYMYDGQTGIIALMFTRLGLFSNTGEMLGTPFGAIFSVLLTDIWKTTPYMALMILAGLQLISDQLYESAQIDGASGWQQFWRITLPMLKPTLLVSLLFRSLDAFRVYDLISVMTRGGPGYATESLSMYAYKAMFSQMNFGKGSALAVILFVCVLSISLVYIHMMNRDSEESLRREKR